MQSLYFYFNLEGDVMQIDPRIDLSTSLIITQQVHGLSVQLTVPFLYQITEADSQAIKFVDCTKLD